MEQGPVEENILEQCLRYDRPYPDPIANAPELAMGLEMFFVGYQDLTTCRDFNGNIPWMSIETYGEKKGWDVDQIEMLHFFVRHLNKAESDFRETERDKTKKQ